MYFDYFTTAALVDELNTLLAGGRVQDVLQLDEFSLGLEIYSQRSRQYLFMSADPEQPRVFLTSGKLRRGSEQPSPILLQMRRYIEGGKLVAIRQPAWERILIFDIVHGEGEYSLIVEPIERRANIILVQDGQIKECIRRVFSDENRVRQLLPGQPYQPPPPQAKLEPQLVGIEDIEKYLFSDAYARIQQALTRHIHGLSPLLGREIAYRAAGKPNAKVDEAEAGEVLEAFQDVIRPLLARDWQPGYTVEIEAPDEDAPDGEIPDEYVTAYAVFRVTYQGEWRPAESVSAALEAFYGAIEGDAAYDAAKKPIRRQIKAARKKIASKLYNLRQQHRDDSEIEYLRQAGELLLAYQYQIQPKQTEFSAQYDLDGDPVKIKLDPGLSALENAQRYFEKYEKAKRSRDRLPTLIKDTQRELFYMDQLATDLDLASNWTEIGEVQEALLAGGYWQGKKRRMGGTGKSSPLKVVAPDGTVIWIGRSSSQNEEVTFKKGASNDLWLHARGVPGAHVIVKNNGNLVSDDTLDYAASLAVYFSQLRSATSGEVIVTERRYIRKIPGGKPGMVRIGKESHPSMSAVPRSPETK